MNEHDFKDALRRTMATHPEPPPMSDSPVLEAAHRDRRRRRAMWAGVSSAAAVAAIAVGVVIVMPSSNDGDGAGGLGVGGAPPSVQPTDDTTPAKVPEQGAEDTETQWPDGQTDRTASSGPQFDRGVALAAELTAVVPDGYEAPEDLVGNGDLAGAPMWYHQAQYADTVDGVDVWEYMADIAVTKGDGVGRMAATATTPDSRTTGEGCDLADKAWIQGDCADVVVDGKKVGVITVDGGDAEMNQYEQWAIFRHEDGTLVSVAQSSFRSYTDFPPLDGLPLTTQQLAELAADPRFNLD